MAVDGAVLSEALRCPARSERDPTSCNFFYGGFKAPSDSANRNFEIVDRLLKSVIYRAQDVASILPDVDIYAKKAGISRNRRANRNAFAQHLDTWLRLRS
jgi:hypothetical protein